MLVPKRDHIQHMYSRVVFDSPEVDLLEKAEKILLNYMKYVFSLTFKNFSEVSQSANACLRLHCQDDE